MYLGHPLHEVQAGRIFVRRVAEGRTALLGLVDLPRKAPVEHQVQARLNSSFWIDLDHGRDPRLPDARNTFQFHPEALRECDAGSLLNTLNFVAGQLPDEIDVFLRQSALEHEDADRQWVIVAGAAADRLVAAPVDGIYEVSAGSVKRIEVEGGDFRGQAISGVLRRPLWGPGGQWGLATSMELSCYAAWVDGERERNARRDPQFADFLLRLREAGGGEGPLVYTQEQFRSREELIHRVVKAMLDPQGDVDVDVGAGVDRLRGG